MNDNQRKPNYGNANAMRGDPINGPRNPASKNAAERSKNAHKHKTKKSGEDEDTETDGGFMLTTSEIIDFSEGADSRNL